MFALYVENSLWLSAVIAAALVFFRATRGKYSAKLPCIVWLIIAAKLIIPWNVPLPQSDYAVELPAVSQTYIAPITQMPVGETVDSEEHFPTENEISEKGIQLDELAMYIWLGGMVTLAFITVLRNASLNRELKIYSMPADDRLNEELEKIAAELGVKTPSLNICDRITTPMATGLLSAEIYLPKENYGDEIEMILRYELIHIKRRDLWKKLIFTAARIIHWFNPFVYIMASEANKSLEIACDAEVIENMDMEYRKNYSYVILNQAGGDRESRALTTCFSHGKGILKARFSEILSQSPKKSGRTVTAFILALCLICGVFVSCTTADDSADYGEMASTWAECLVSRNGEARYEMMDSDMKNDFEASQMYDGQLNYSIGWSSPWVISYEIEVDGDTAEIHYILQDSTQATYYMDEKLLFGEEDGKTVVIDYAVSQLQAEPVGTRQQLSEMNIGSVGFEGDDTLRQYIESYAANTVYYGFTDDYFVDSIFLTFDDVNVSDGGIEAEFALKIILHNYDAEVSRIESGTELKSLPKADDFDGNYSDEVYYESGISVTYNLVFTCDADYTNTDSFMLTDSGSNAFIQPSAFNSSGEKTVFGSLQMDGNDVIVSLMQFNTDIIGLTGKSYYITDWVSEERFTLTDESEMSFLDDPSFDDLQGYYWVTVNENNEILMITQQSA